MMFMIYFNALGLLNKLISKQISNDFINAKRVDLLKITTKFILPDNFTDKTNFLIILFYGTSFQYLLFLLLLLFLKTFAAFNSGIELFCAF